MKDTKIEWCDHTFNPWVGCTKLSPACDHCYAETWARRTGQSELWDGERRLTSRANWQAVHRWHGAAIAAGTRPRVFCASLADVFDNQVKSDWREHLWGLIFNTPQLDWLLLTKRPQNIADMLPTICAWPLDQVWLGTTVENQQEAERRIPALLAVPAVVHFVSCEPLLGPLDLTRFMMPTLSGKPRVEWVIVGGESGPKARPMHPDWARSLRDQCADAGIPFFFKQWGEWFPRDQWEDNPRLVLPDDCDAFIDGERTRVLFDDLRRPCPMHRVGKKAAGRLLDGREYNEFPQPRVFA